MKKILLFILIILGFLLTSCVENLKKPEVEFKMVSYAILTNEESLKNKTYSTSDFDLEGLEKITDCNEISDINNIDSAKYRKIIKFNFPNITEDVFNKNTETMLKDKRVAHYYNSSIKLKIFNYESLEKNVNFSNIITIENYNCDKELNNIIINSLDEKEEYISYLKEEGYQLNPIVEIINKYDEDYFNNNKSIIFVDFLLANPGYYFDFTSMYLENEKLNLTFNRYQASGATVQMITNRILIIECDSNLSDVEINVTVNIK